MKKNRNNGRSVKYFAGSGAKRPLLTFCSCGCLRNCTIARPSDKSGRVQGNWKKREKKKKERERERETMRGRWISSDGVGAPLFSWKRRVRATRSCKMSQSLAGTGLVFIPKMQASGKNNHPKKRRKTKGNQHVWFNSRLWALYSDATGL